MTNTAKKDNFNAIIEITAELGRQDLVDFCKHEIELLEKEASKSDESKSKKENEELMNTLYDNLLELASLI